MSFPALHAAAAQHAALSPRLQRAVRLLQMSSLDFAQVVRGALDTNPFLEQEEAAEPPDPGLASSPAEGSWWDLPPAAGARHEGDPDAVFDTLQAPGSLAAHLLSQLDVMPLPARDRDIAAAVVACLDEDGYLRIPLGETAEGLGLAPAPDADELAIALRRVQALDPAGVGARSVAECLTLQLAAITCEPSRELARVLLRDHAEALAGRDARALAKHVGRPPEEVQAACAALRRLDPHPGWRHSPPSTAYVTPDVIVRHVRGRWTAQLNESVVPRVKVNRDYADLFRRHRGGQHGALGADLQEARWTVRNVAQRFSTILAVAQAVVARQHAFLAYGAMAMKPLALRDIAQEVGVHESTVSRVTHHKYMATPFGVFELKYFFSRGLATASGGRCSPTAVRDLIRTLVEEEAPGRALSDVELARELTLQGLQVARRTVTKYRQQLKIEPAERRGRARPG